MNNLVQRTLSGIVYLAVIIGSLFLGEYSFGALFLVVSVLATTEFYNISGYADFTNISVTGISAAALTFILFFLCASGVIGYKYGYLILLVPVLFMISGLYLRKEPLQVLRSHLFGFLYVSLPMALTNFLVFPAANDHHYTHRIILGLLTLIWINDTGAYVTGMLFGRHKLFPRISPKKSWEGFAGGTLFTLGAAFLMKPLMAILDQYNWLILAVIVSIFGVFGDLSESLIKRSADIKDSGTLIPGHGGILDRFDSMLFVVPVSAVYLYLI